jgi:hypothetical protein
MATTSEPSTPNPVKKKRFHWKRWLLIALGSPLLLLILYTLLVLNWSYSTGERAGYVQKFSKRGWLVKTWEGELAMVTIPGTLVEKFEFTVHADSVANKINATLGKKVSLMYEQHVGIPTSLFGDTGYFIVDVRPLE